MERNKVEFGILVIGLILFVSIYILSEVRSKDNSCFGERGDKFWVVTISNTCKMGRDFGVGEEIILRGIVAEKPIQTISKQIMEVGEIVVVTDRQIEYEIGDFVSVSGRIEERVTEGGKREFVLNYPTIELLEVGESGLSAGLVVKQNVERLQEKFSGELKRGLGEPHGSLLVGILLGLRQSMPRSFYDALIVTGTLHVIAASGMNITIVAKVMIEGLGQLMRKKWALLISFGGILFYTLLAGASPAVVRAAIMGSLVYLAEFMGKDYWASWSLALAMGLMLLWDFSLLEDVGFWLSVSATGGILWLSPMIERWLEGFGGWVGRRGASRRVERVIGEHKLVGVRDKAWVETKINFKTTVAAQIATLPILVGVFGRVSVVSVLVNVLLLGLVPVIMALGGAKLVLGLVWQPLGDIAGLLVWLPLEIFVRVVEWFGELPGVSGEVEWLKFDSYGWWFLVGFYGVVGIWWWRGRDSSRKAEKHKG